MILLLYYDGGQNELLKVIKNVYTNTLKSHYEYRSIKPADYKLFQCADLFCTLSLLKTKNFHGKELTKSEKIFFGSYGKLKTNYLKTFNKIEFSEKNKKIASSIHH